MPAPQKFVEIGRIAYAVNGAAKGKLLAIIDAIDYKRVLVEGPCTGVARQLYQLNHLQLTKFKINIKKSPKTQVVEDQWRKSKITFKFSNTVMAKNLARTAKRKRMTDFDKFKMNHLLTQRSKLVKKAFKTIDKRKNALDRKNTAQQKLKNKLDKERKDKEKARGPGYVAKIKKLKEAKEAKLESLIEKRIAAAKAKRAKRADKMKVDEEGKRLRDANGKCIRGSRGNKKTSKLVRQRFIQKRNGGFVVKKNKKLLSVAHQVHCRDVNRVRQVKAALEARQERLKRRESRLEKKALAAAKKGAEATSE